MSVSSFFDPNQSQTCLNLFNLYKILESDIIGRILSKITADQAEG